MVDLPCWINYYNNCYRLTLFDAKLVRKKLISQINLKKAFQYLNSEEDPIAAATDKNGKNPLNIAAENGDIETIKFFGSFVKKS